MPPKRSLARGRATPTTTSNGASKAKTTPSDPHNLKVIRRMYVAEHKDRHLYAQEQILLYLFECLLKDCSNNKGVLVKMHLESYHESGIFGPFDDKNDILEAAQNVDDHYFVEYVSKSPERREGTMWIRLEWGNEPTEMITDYHRDLAEVIKPAEDLCDKINELINEAEEGDEEDKGGDEDE